MVAEWAGAGAAWALFKQVMCQALDSVLMHAILTLMTQGDITPDYGKTNDLACLHLSTFVGRFKRSGTGCGGAAKLRRYALSGQSHFSWLAG